MILRFTAWNSDDFINIDTKKEEWSEEYLHEHDKKYIELSLKDLDKICEEMDFNCFNHVEKLSVDQKKINDEDCLPFEVAVEN